MSQKGYLEDNPYLLDFDYWNKQPVEDTIRKLHSYDISSKKFINSRIKRFRNRKRAYSAYYDNKLWRLFCRPLLIIIAWKLGWLEKEWKETGIKLSDDDGIGAGSDSLALLRASGACLGLAQPDYQSSR